MQEGPRILKQMVVGKVRDSTDFRSFYPWIGGLVDTRPDLDLLCWLKGNIKENTHIFDPRTFPVDFQGHISLFSGGGGSKWRDSVRLIQSRSKVPGRSVRCQPQTKQNCQLPLRGEVGFL